MFPVQAETSRWARAGMITFEDVVSPRTIISVTKRQSNSTQHQLVNSTRCFDSNSLGKRSTEKNFHEKRSTGEKMSTVKWSTR